MKCIGDTLCKGGLSLPCFAFDAIAGKGNKTLSDYVNYSWLSQHQNSLTCSRKFRAIPHDLCVFSEWDIMSACKYAGHLLLDRKTFGPFISEGSHRRLP